jgi:hypothetical protein
VSSSLCDEVPHIFIPKSHLEPREFLISSAKRLLQQYRHKADMREPLINVRYWEMNGLSADIPLCRSLTQSRTALTAQWNLWFRRNLHNQLVSWCNTVRSSFGAGEKDEPR